MTFLHASSHTIGRSLWKPRRQRAINQRRPWPRGSRTRTSVLTHDLETMDSFDDHINSIRIEWSALKETWFRGETLDPVFEGVVRDFCAFDDAMHLIYEKVGHFMKGAKDLSESLIVLSDGVSAGLARTNDRFIASDSCKMREVTNQIARGDAPNSAVAKLRRDMHYNILAPMQSHINNNRSLKLNLEVRRQKLVELNAARKQYDECVQKGLSSSDKRFLQVMSNLESAKLAFNDVDRNVFEWLYILEEYRGDVLDSTQQTLKYLQYEFFASAAHAISGALPARMEFRPMVEMTPEHLEAQIHMELEQSEEKDNSEPLDFSQRLIEKKVREEPEDDADPPLPVDPLSLSSLLSQGFEEGPARRALRIHRNDTQQALDWLINGSVEQMSRTQTVSDGVRMPTTVKHVQRYKAARKARQEKLRQEREGGGGSDTSRVNNKKINEGRLRTQDSDSALPKSKENIDTISQASDQAPTVDVSNLLSVAVKPADKHVSSASFDLLGFDDAKETSMPMDSCGSVETSSLPPSMDLIPDDLFPTSDPGIRPCLLQEAEPAPLLTPTMSSGDDFEGLPPELMSMVKALAAQSNVSPQQLLLTAQNLANGGVSM